MLCLARARSNHVTRVASHPNTVTQSRTRRYRELLTSPSSFLHRYHHGTQALISVSVAVLASMGCTAFGPFTGGGTAKRASLGSTELLAHHRYSWLACRTPSGVRPSLPASFAPFAKTMVGRLIVLTGVTTSPSPNAYGSGQIRMGQTYY